METPAFLSGITFADPLELHAFVDCLTWALSSDDIIRSYRADTGVDLDHRRSHFDAMIDKACGFETDHAAQLKAFAEWVRAAIWGDGWDDTSEVA